MAKRKVLISVVTVFAIVFSTLGMSLFVGAADLVPTYLYQQNFDSVTDVSTLGYTAVSGNDGCTLSIQNGQLLVDNTGTGNADAYYKIFDQTTVNDDYYLEYDLTLLDPTSGTLYVAIVGYFTDNNNFAGAWIRFNGRMHLEQRKDSAYTKIGATQYVEIADYGSTAGVDFKTKVKLHFHDGTVDMYVNNQLAMEGTAPIVSPKSNAIALLAKGKTKALIDNVSVYTLAEAAGTTAPADTTAKPADTSPTTSDYMIYVYFASILAAAVVALAYTNRKQTSHK